MKLKYCLMLVVLMYASSVNAVQILWNKDVARENALASISLIKKAESAAHIPNGDLEKVYLPSLDRLIAGFTEQYDQRNPAVEKYESCLDALQYFRPYVTVSLKPDSPGRTASLTSSKKAYEVELKKCTLATRH